MGNSNNKSSALRKSQSVPDTQRLAADALVFDKQKSVSQLRLNNAYDKPTKPGKTGKKNKQQNEELLQLNPAEATFLPEFPLRGDLEELEFDIIDVIAGGAFGNVIKVQRDDQKKFYAVKVLDKAQIIEEGAIRQCKDEATIQSMAGQHPLVVKAHEYWQSRRSLYIVLDYVPHGDMFTLWTFHGAFPENLVQLYIAEMAMVVDFLHNASVIYRDIKMENILFNAKGHIQLTDFGLAKWLKGGEQTRTVCGTLQYMAPEVLSVYPYSHSADWWSLGVLMYAMLAGRYPVDGVDTHTRMAQRVFECDFLLPSHISDAAQDVINRVLTKSPHKRLCDVNNLQDLDFFQDIFFSDLIEQKLNPLDVVPEDFFPMTGQSWAPQELTGEEQSHFGQFDDSNNTLTNEPDYPHSYVNPRTSHHHPEPVHRLQPLHLHNQQSAQDIDKQYTSHSESQQLDRQHSSHGEPQLHKPPQIDRQYSSHGEPQPRQLSQELDRQYSSHGEPQPRQLPQELDRQYSSHGEPQPRQLPQELDRQYSPHNGRHSHNQPYNLQQRHLPQQKSFPDFQRASTSHDAGLDVITHNHSIRGDGWLGKSTSDYSLQAGNSEGRQNSGNDGRSHIVPQSGHNGRSLIVPESNFDANSKERSNRISEGSQRSNASQDRHSYGDNNQNGLSNAGSVRITNSNLGVVSMSSVSSWNNNNSSDGNTNRLSSGPEYKTFEAPPTITLKTLASQSSSQTRYNQALLGNGSPIGNLTSSGYTLQNHVINKQAFGIPAQEVKYQTQVSNTRMNSQTAGFNGPSLGQGYQLLEAPPIVSAPSAQIRFNQNEGVPQNGDRFPPATNNIPHNFSTNSTNLSHTISHYQKQAPVNPAPQRPSVPAKPVPPQKPNVGPKPAVPVKPVPTPRQSLKINHKNETQINSGPPVRLNQASSTSVSNQYLYTSVTSHTQHSLNANTINDSVSQQHGWNSQVLPPTDQIRNRSASISNILTSSSRPDISTRSPSIDDQNFQWKLPAGTTPSFV